MEGNFRDEIAELPAPARLAAPIPPCYQARGLYESGWRRLGSGLKIRRFPAAYVPALPRAAASPSETEAVTESNAIVNEAAERYARALFDLVEDAGALDAAAADMASLAGALKESADLRRMAASPLHDSEDKAKALIALADAAGYSPLTRNFLGVIARNQRAAELTGITSAFLAMVATKRGHTRAMVTSAAPLDAAETEALRASLRTALGHDVELQTSVDPALIAGLRVRVGSRLFDSTLRSKLEGLRSAMKEA